MIEQGELIERWANAERVLIAMPEHERQNHWDMGTWGTLTDCGTIACAAGHCGLDPWFQSRGFKLEFREGDREARQPNVSQFFGAEGSTRIFYNGRARPVEQLIDEVHSYLGELQAQVGLVANRDLPLVGAEWPDQGGIYAGPRLGVDGDPNYLLIVGPEHDGPVDWRNAEKWATSLSIAGHSDFALSNRSDGFALFDRVRDLFKPDWYWLTQHESDSDTAWVQYFDDGDQGYWGKYLRLRARAVRRLPIQ